METVRGGSCPVGTLGCEREQTKEPYLEGRLSGGLEFLCLFWRLKRRESRITDSGTGSLKKPDVMNEARSLREAGKVVSVMP